MKDESEHGKEKIGAENESKLVYRPPDMETINNNPVLKAKYEKFLEVCKNFKVINLNETLEIDNPEWIVNLSINKDEEKE